MRRAEAGIQVDKFYPPTDWLDNNNKQIDIRKNAENNSIVLLVGHSADFSKYSLLGLLADTSSGTYDVYIDDVLVGSGITKKTQYDIDFSTINTSYGSATTPEALVLHKVVVKPTTSGATITTFNCKKTTGETRTQQGVLWYHFELDNTITSALLLSESGVIRQINLIAITSKNNYLNTVVSCYDCSKLIFVPKVQRAGWNSFRSTALKRLIVNNYTGKSDYTFWSSYLLEQIQGLKFGVGLYVFSGLRNLKLLPYKNSGNSTNGEGFLVNATNLYPTKIDITDKTITKLGMYGTSTYPTRGLRGLKVSNEAPFTGSSPQINVSYTGLDRDALVELFQSLPTVTGGQTLNCVACSGNNLAKVGSPTIDENGVASGFSSADYLQIAQNSLGQKTEIIIKFTTSNSFSTTMGLFSHGGNYIYIKTNRQIETQFSYGGSNKLVAGRTTLQNNTTYYLKFVTEYNKGVEIWLSTDGINYVLENSSNYWWGTLSVQYVRYGYLGAFSAFNGSIDLNETLIKTDRNYLMKGYITDTDKAIATDKGWGLVLS